MNKRKNRNIFLAAFVLLCCTGMMLCVREKPAYAAAVVAEGSAGDIKWHLNTDGVLQFEGDGVFGTFSTIGLPWKPYQDSIKKVVFDMNTVEGGDISNYFSGCMNLTAVNNIPYGVTSLYATFEKCESLVTVGTIPDTVQNMTQTFRRCKKLNQEIMIPKNVTACYGTFSDCISLTHTPMIQSDSIQNMGYMFQNTAITAPPRLSMVVRNLTGTFYGCGELRKFPVIPDSVEVMKSTFQECPKISGTCVIPSKVTDLSYCFSECVFMEDTPVISSLVLKNMSHSFYHCASMQKAPAIPESVTDVSYAFWNCGEMKTAPDIPARVKKMAHCLAGCWSASGSMTIYAVISKKENYEQFAGEGAVYNDDSSTAVFLGGRGTGLTVNYVNNNVQYAVSYLTTGWNCGGFAMNGYCGRLKLGKAVLQNISSCDVEETGPYVYTGKAIKPEIRISYAGVPLAAGTDYTAVYTNCTDAGIASVYIEGKGHYQGTRNIQYVIGKASFKNAKGYNFEGIYDGSSHGITVVCDEGAKVEYGIQSGQYTTEECPVFTMPGVYTVYFRISKPNYETYMGNALVKINAANLTVQSQGFSGDYDGNPHSISVSANEGARVLYGLKEGECHLSSCPAYVSVGRYTVYYEVTKAGYQTVTGRRMVIINKKQVTEIQFPLVSAIQEGECLSLSLLEFISNRYGTFSWQTPGVVPACGENVYLLIFTPNDMFNYDFSQVEGYEELDGRIHRTIPVTVYRQKPEETPVPQEPDAETSTTETGTLEKPEEPEEPEIAGTYPGEEDEVSELMMEIGLLSQELMEEEEIGMPITQLIKNLDGNRKQAMIKPAKSRRLAVVRGLKVRRSGNKLRITWKKVTGCRGYQMKIAKNRRMKKILKKKNIRKNRIQINGKKRKTYFIRVRAYKMVYGKKVYGKWSKVCSIM